MSAVLPDIEPTTDQLDAVELGQDVDVVLDLEDEPDDQPPPPLAPARGTVDLAALVAKARPRPRTPRYGWSTLACTDHENPDLWWPAYRGGKVTDGTRSAIRRQEEAARAICRGCPSRPACLLDALANDEPTAPTFGGGIWGGATHRDLDTLRGALGDASDRGDQAAVGALWTLVGDGMDPQHLAARLRGDIVWEQAA